MSKVWGYIGTTKIIELNPERKEEAFAAGMKILLEWKLKELAQKKSHEQEKVT